MGESRLLVHCDLDAFFAAVEVLHRGLDPARPLIIGSDPQQGRGRGIVSTCNYAARTFGIRSAMPISEAWRRCPGPPHGHGTYVRGSHRLYGRASRKVMDVLRGVGGAFEQASIDEAYLDITEAVHGDWDAGLALCEHLQSEVRASTGLSASFGLAPTRILAKMSSEERKPGGVFRLMPGDAAGFLHGRPMRDLPGVGPATATALSEWGVETIDEAYALGTLALGRMAGDRFAKWLSSVVEGTSSDEVSPLQSRRSIGKERTFEVDVQDHEVVMERLFELVHRVMESARQMGVVGRLAEVKIRYTGFDTHTHRRSIPVGMDDVDVFIGIAERLFALSVEHERPVRLIGFRLGDLEDPRTRQTTLMRYEGESASFEPMHRGEDG